ncbi:energy transducer TonB [Flavobacterium sp. KACC 22761]|uniref:energy transducer TonB n=1 Tax=Flavobacterium sp. KACC 22761 TaxID=3092665 RepID=UPI002A750C81|nr:energy transducer TonB [Flavobacterium sp. KACC 22761]WPO79163.1 energy transducer TonB [Flavobacterium sp. KACC 22761]
MKKLSILILICATQSVFSQKTQRTSETISSNLVLNDSVDYMLVDKSKDHVENLNYKVYTSFDIDEKPDFPGGMDLFFKFVDENFKKPAKNPEIKGKVYVEFIIEKNGSLTGLKVLRDIGYGTGDEAIRILKKCPKWIPGELNGKKVRVLFGIPLIIK